MSDSIDAFGFPDLGDYDAPTPPPPDPTDLTVFQWARFALNGDLVATEPDDATLTPIMQVIVAEWKLSTPCYFSGTPTPDDVKAYNEAIGKEIASRFFGGVAGGQFASLVQSVELGPVVEKVTAGKDVLTLAADLHAESANARLRISCVRQSLKDNKVPSFPGVGLSGRRRSLGGFCGTR